MTVRPYITNNLFSTSWLVNPKLDLRPLGNLFVHGRRVAISPWQSPCAPWREKFAVDSSMIWRETFPMTEMESIGNDICTVSYYTMIYHLILYYTITIYIYIYIHIHVYHMMWCDVIWYDMIWYAMMWYDIIWYYMIWYDIIWYHMILYDITWYYMI